MDLLNPTPAGSERSGYSAPHPDLAAECENSPTGIAPLHGHDGVNEFFVRSLRAGATPALGRKQHAVLSFPQQVVQQGGGLQNDGGTEDACRAHQEGEQTGGVPA